MTREKEAAKTREHSGAGKRKRLEVKQATHCKSRKMSGFWRRVSREVFEWIPVSGTRLKALLLTFESLSINP